MTPRRFVDKWRPVVLTERAAAQSHFNDLCDLLDHPKPMDMEPTGENFTFEKGVKKSGGGDGFADVWYKQHFAWEYKKRKRNLDDALGQLARYALALENPPLHIVCDTDRFRIVTAWTNTVPRSYDLSLEDILDHEKRELLQNAFHAPDSLRPGKSREDLTREAADKFSTLVRSLQARGNCDLDVAHFVNRLVFLYFAEDVGLLKHNYFRRVIGELCERPRDAKHLLSELFATLSKGGRFGLDRLPHINGGLFDDGAALDLTDQEIGLVKAAGSQDWAHIDPTIFGTLFERFLDPEKRSQIGAHYTDAAKILLIIRPVLIEPLQTEWAETRSRIEELTDKARKRGAKAKEWSSAEGVRSTFLERLRNLSILDPACGSGNFLYLALQAVKDIEHLANQECETLGLPPRIPMVGPEILRGIEINPLAAELAKTSIWIGDIQWGIRNGIHGRGEPILRQLETVENRNALLNSDGTEADWPKAEIVIGNPPFLGGKLLRRSLGDTTVERLFRAYKGRVPQEADLVTYWFEKARKHMHDGCANRVGFVATNSIRGGANRRVLESTSNEFPIYDAWSDEPWVVDGASVRVSLVCFTKQTSTRRRLNGRAVLSINNDLSCETLDLTKAKRLPENAETAFMGDTKGGAFDVDGETARRWLALPLNPNGRPNSDVLKVWVNGLDLTRRPRDMWIVDFGLIASDNEAAFYQEPFTHVLRAVKPIRIQNKRAAYAQHWWHHVEPRPAMFDRLRHLKRYIATPRVAKHRLFVWVDSRVCPDCQVIVIAKDDDFTFGVLHSRFHEVWSLLMGTSLEDRPRYTPTTTFETYPFPSGDRVQSTRIAEASRKLDQARAAWLYPSDLVEKKAEVAVGYPDRVLAKDADAEAILRKRMMTALYNERPQWLVNLHSELDAAVAAAYGWSEDITSENAMSRLLDLNLYRRATEQPSAH